MKSLKLIVGIVLWLVVIFMGYKLYKQVEEPVSFNSEYNTRYKATKNRLMDIKVAQDYYKIQHNEYASNFNDLINTIKNEKLTIIKTIGDKDDTSVVVVYDTILVPIIDEIMKEKKFKGTENIEDLKTIPYTQKTFKLATDTIKVQRVELAVFQASATKNAYLFGLQDKFIRNPEIEDLSIGSLESASGKGSWE